MCRTISLTAIAVSSSETQRVSCALATWSSSIDDETSSIASSRLCSDFRNLLKRWWNAANKYPSRFEIERPFSRFLWRALATDFSTDSQTSAARASVSASEFLLRSSSLACAKTRGHAARAAANSVSSTARAVLSLASEFWWSTHSPYGSGLSIGSLVQAPANGNGHQKRVTLLVLMSIEPRRHPQVA